ncbi:MAG TPA: HupE/UreJ family protein [Burkholderiaceae bacterium]
MTLTNSRHPLRIALSLASCALPIAAMAHPGSLAEHAARSHGFIDGFAHPFTGLDHLGAMLAVGLWSARSLRRAWIAPAAFVACLLAGALATSNGLAVAGAEPMIAASLLVIGLLLAARAALPAAAAAAVVGGFAFFHGASHGVELGAGPALAGMVLATALLHLAGIAIGLALRGRSAWWTRIAGAGLAMFGLVLLGAGA